MLLRISTLNFFLYVLPFFISGCFHNYNTDEFLYKCDDTFLNEYSSPDKKATVFIHQRNCGATTDFSTILSIRKNAQSSQSSQSTIIAAAKGRISIDIQWLTESRLRVKTYKSFVNKKDRFEDIEIIYEKLEK